MPYNRYMDKVPLILHSALRKARVKTIPKGQIILYEGDVTADAYVINEGVVKIYDIDEQGNEKILHLIGRPGIIPFAFFSGHNDPTRWYYSALTDCEVSVVQQQKLIQAMATNSELSKYLINWFSMEVHEILTRLSSLGKTTVRDKLVAALKFLAVCHSQKAARTNWHRVAVPINHQLLADMMGVTRESASITMKELQDEKIVRTPRQNILEINLDRLVAQ